MKLFLGRVFLSSPALATSDKSEPPKCVGWYGDPLFNQQIRWAFIALVALTSYTIGYSRDSGRHLD